MKISDMVKNIFSKNAAENTKSYSCPACKKEAEVEVLLKNNFICPDCGAYVRIAPIERIALIADSGTFCPTDNDVISQNIINFPEYEEKLENARNSSGEAEGVTCGFCKIGGIECGIFVMNPYFMMGSMGIVVGEKITRLFEDATRRSLPVVGFTASGGARMQEGMYSLMQMAKVSGAVKRHSDAKNLYIAVLTDPTTGGVTASFAMEADITIAEPNALIGFAGARVIKETTGKELPKGFQRAEFLLEHGFVDAIIGRNELKDKISSLLKLHRKENLKNESI